MKQGREIVYGYLGVTVSTPTSRERRDAGADPELGVRVEAVDKGSPAYGVIQEEDFLVKINNQNVLDSDQFVRLVGIANLEHASELQIYRNGQPKTLSISLGRRQSVASSVTRQSRRIRWEGLLLGPTPQNWKQDSSKSERGLVVLAVAEKSRYAKQGVHEGDIITSIAGKALADVTDLQQVLNDLPPTQRELKVIARKSVVASAHD
jgi:serine protease Do